jgi:hypothetical protein
MNLFIRFSAALYGWLARLYPDEIRRRWEAEMTDTFALQLAEAWREPGWTGVIATWYYALAELFAIALPRQLLRAGLLVPVGALTAAGVIFYGLAWALQNSLALNRIFYRAFGKLWG